MPSPTSIVLWQLGASDQLGRVVIIEATHAFDAHRIAQRWLSSNGLPNEIGMSALAPFKPRGQNASAGLLVVSLVDGEIEERTLTPLEIKT